MNERKIIDRKYLCDLAKEVGLTTLDLEALGENHHWEIVVEGNLLGRFMLPTGNLPTLLFLTAPRIMKRSSMMFVARRTIDVEDREMTVKALEDSIQGCSLSPIETMTIRKYCKFYRIANEAYKAYHKKRGICGRINKDSKRDLQKISDVAYYKYMKYVDVENLYNVDSQEDFIRFATDHYGELGLSRLNILASNVQHQGWKIVVFNSYSSNVGLAMEVAVSLYKADAPLHIYDAEKLLSILKEEDFVRLIPDSYHNYMGYQEEGTVYELPWEYECSDEKNSFLTLEQYHDIISHTEWESEKRVEPIS